MGFFADWIAQVDVHEQMLERVRDKMIAGVGPSPEMFNAAVMEFQIAQMTREEMKASRIIKVPADQLMLFAELERVQGQDYLKLRSPFPEIYIDPVNGVMSAKRYQDRPNAQVKGMLVSFDVFGQRSDAVWLQSIRADFGLQESQFPFAVIKTTWFMPLSEAFENNYINTILITSDGTLHYPDHGRSTGVVDLELRESMVTWLIHILNFLTSPAVVLSKCEPSVKLQKARASKGKEALPGWYEISYKKQAARREAESTGNGVKHGFRYDVRGHFMHFTKGRMAGRVIWCPPHQRGLAHTLYKPKVYRIENELDDQPEVYGG